MTPPISWSLLGAALAAAALGLGALTSGPAAHPEPPALSVEPPAAVVPPGELRFEGAVTAASRLPRIRSLLISVDGHLVEERYFHGASPQRAANLKSVSKSIIGLLVGVAIDRGAISDVDVPIDRHLPEARTVDPAKGAITIEDLLTMRSGLETTSNRNYGRWVLSGNWVRHVLQRPFVDEPGGRMIYSTGNSHLLSAILTRATGMSTAAFARETLAGPLGIQLPPWTRDPQGIYFGGNEMHLRPRDVLRIGELMVNGGRHDGRQIVSSAWIDESTVPRTMSRRSDRQYGYGWWIRSMAGQPVVYAWGYGGQFIFTIEPLRTVVVVTSVSEPGSERREHLDAVYDLVERHVMPVAVTAALSESRS